MSKKMSHTVETLDNEQMDDLSMSPCRIHFFLQAKGGCSKTITAVNVIQHQLDNGRIIIPIDADALNPTLARFKGLNVERLIMTSADNPNEIVPTRFDDFIEKVIETEADFAFDNGANTAPDLLKYINDMEVFGYLSEHGKKVYVHIPIAGGSNYADTLDYFTKLMEVNGIEHTYPIIWLNEYFGDVSTGGDDDHQTKPLRNAFQESSEYEAYKEKLRAIILFQRADARTTLVDITNVYGRFQTYKEVMQDPNIRLMAKERIKRYRDEVYNQLNLALAED